MLLYLYLNELDKAGHQHGTGSEKWLYALEEIDAAARRLSQAVPKDTVLVLPMQTIEADLQADNPGTWMFHCHNIYHAELGMMTSLKYV